MRVVSSSRISIGPAGCRINRDYARRGWAAETGHPSWGPRDPSQNVHADTACKHPANNADSVGRSMRRMRWGGWRTHRGWCCEEGRGGRERKGMCLPGACLSRRRPRPWAERQGIRSRALAPSRRPTVAACDWSMSPDGDVFFSKLQSSVIFGGKVVVHVLTLRKHLTCSGNPPRVYEDSPLNPECGFPVE